MLKNGLKNWKKLRHGQWLVMKITEREIDHVRPLILILDLELVTVLEMALASWAMTLQ